jgi:hypothetical protein
MRGANRNASSPGRPCRPICLNDTGLANATSAPTAEALPLEPLLHVFEGANLRSLLKFAPLRMGGVYVNFWQVDGGRLYCRVGCSTDDLSYRMCGSTHLREPFPVLRTIFLCDANNRLSRADIKSLERIVYLAIDTPGAGAGLVNQLPYGASVAQDRYSELRRFCSRAALAIKARHLLFKGVSAAALRTGPRGDEDTIAGPESLLDGPQFELMPSRKNLDAIVTQNGKRWVVHPGSEISETVMPSIGCMPLVWRNEFRHSHIIKPTDRAGVLMTTLPLVFDSANAAYQFICGSSGSPRFFRPLPKGRPKAGRLYPTLKSHRRPGASS